MSSIVKVVEVVAQSEKSFDDAKVAFVVDGHA